MGFDRFLSLVFAIYATFAPGVGIAKELNERRDIILDAGSSYDLEHKTLIYENDWIGIFYGYLQYQLAISAVLFYLVWYFRPTSQMHDGAAFVICLALGLASVWRLVIEWRAFGVVDRKAIEKHLRKLRESAQGDLQEFPQPDPTLSRALASGGGSIASSAGEAAGVADRQP